MTACGDSSNNDGNNDNSNSAADNNANDDSATNDGGGDTDYKVAMVTDVGGVDDKSFNQSAWEGLKAWGEEHGLEEGEGFDYAQSSSDSDYTPNLQTLVRADYDLVFGIGFKLDKAMKDIASQYPDKSFGI